METWRRPNPDKIGLIGYWTHDIAAENGWQYRVYRRHFTCHDHSPREGIAPGWRYCPYCPWVAHG